ncbi:lipopolysaccharide assembly protein LapA domain-containing protein [Pseudomonas sp. MAG733B]|uniref:lipopolysaccharide assembly protein LapA domain-containing protein n=1 Tax=Pseudomonas sp. MAG733B TaxID=3122079 RepID=UPI0030D5E743
MHRVKKLFLLLILLMAFAATLLFLLENQQPASLVFIGWAAPQWPVSVFILGALLLGLAVAPLLALIVSRRHGQRTGR